MMALGVCFSMLGMVLVLVIVVKAHVELHGPRDRFWKHHGEQRSLIHEGVNYYDTIEACLGRHLTPEDKEAMETEVPERRVGTMFSDEFQENMVFFVAVENAMTPSHVKAVQSLAHCIREAIPSKYESRSMYIEFQLDQDIGLGGNNPTHLAPLVGVFLPIVYQGILHTLQVAYDAAGWSKFGAQHDYPQESDNFLPHPKDVGFRVSEHLTYKDFAKAGLFDHNDGSDCQFTCNFAFSGPGDYDGGFFYLKYGGSPPLKTLFWKPQKYGAMVFLGGRYDHGVTEIMSGHREMFSSEFWDYPDSPFGTNLAVNFASSMERYVKLCDREAAKGNTGPCQVDIKQVFYDLGNAKEKTASSKSDSGKSEVPEDGNEEEEEEEEDTTSTGKGLIPVRVRDDAGNEFDMTEFRPETMDPHFLVKQSLKPGEIYPLWFRDFTRYEDPETFVVGLPTGLQQALQKFISYSGMFDMARSIVFDDDRIIRPETSRIYFTKDGIKWKATMLGEWHSDYIRLESIDKRATRSMSSVFRNFDMVSTAIATKLGLSSNDLSIRGFDANLVSKSKDGRVLSIDSEFDDADYRVVIPVRIPTNQSTKVFMEIGDSTEAEEAGETWGLLNQQLNVGVVFGSKSPSGVGDCDYRQNNDFFMMFTIYLDKENKSQTS